MPSRSGHGSGVGTHLDDVFPVLERCLRARAAAPRLQLIREEVERFYRRFAVDPDLLELRNISLVAEIILRLATARRESRGLHANRDCPETDDMHFRRDSVLGRVGEVTWGGTIPDSRLAETRR